MDCSTPCFLSFTISQSLLKFMSIDLVMPSNDLILCRPLFLLPSIFPSIRVFSNGSILGIRWSKYWSFSFSISPSKEYSGLISFTIDWFISLQFKGLLRIFSSTTIQKHPFFGTQPSLWSNTYIHTWLLEKPGKSLTIWPFVSKVISLLFNMLSRFFMAFLPRSTHLLINHTCAVLCVTAQSCLTLCDPTDRSQAPLSMGFSRQQYWSGLPCPPPGDLFNPGVKPRSPTLQADSLPAEIPGKP